MAETPNHTRALYRIWVAHCPFRKNGAPVLGSFGSTIAPVVVMKIETWKRLCAAIPDLQATQFEVGADEE
jgi:hypothetical protein